MDNMIEKIEIGLNEEGQIVVQSDVKTMDFLKKTIKAIEIAVFDQLAREGHNGSMLGMVVRADAIMREALEDIKHA